MLVLTNRMMGRKSVILYAKAFLFIFFLCFTVASLAAIRQKHHKDTPANVESRVDGNIESPPHHNEKHHSHNEKLDATKLKLKKDIKKHVARMKDEKMKAAEKVEHNVDTKDTDLKFHPHQEKAVENVAQVPVPHDDKAHVDKKDAHLLVKPKAAPRPPVPGHHKGHGQHPHKIEKEKEKHEDGEEEEEEGDEKEDGEGEEEDDDRDDADLRKLKPIKLEDLQPPDHLEGVKMEQDGHLNRQYQKEVFLGNHEEFEQGTEEEAEERLKDIFRKVDVNKDGVVTQSELEDWIVLKVQEHFDEAAEEAQRIFKHLDTDLDGYVAWKEFHMHFLIAKGNTAKEAAKHVEDYETLPLDPDDKERLIRYKFRWAEADEEPQDNKLSLDEFKAFRHPEQSSIMLQRMVDDIVENLDKDDDKIITIDEFAALPPGDVDTSFQESDKQWQAERRKEFTIIIDTNRNGKVTRDELKNYVNPLNPNHSKVEADNLIQLADENKDGKLSLEEILNNAELFIGSKMVDTGRNFHDEF